MVSMEVIILWLGIFSTVFVYSRVFILAAWLLTQISTEDVKCSQREMVDTIIALGSSVLFTVLQITFISNYQILVLPLSTVVVLYLFALGTGKVMMDSLIRRHQFYSYYQRNHCGGDKRGKAS
jgi:hypothetical protein